MYCSRQLSLGHTAQFLIHMFMYQLQVVNNKISVHTVVATLLVSFAQRSFYFLFFKAAFSFGFHVM